MAQRLVQGQRETLESGQHLVLRRLWVVAKQRVHRHDDPRRAEAAL